MIFFLFYLQPAGKKNNVLSNEARKEMAKLAKVTKDERRAQLDARHKYLVSKLADGLGIGENEVEDFLISDDKVMQNLSQQWHLVVLGKLDPGMYSALSSYIKQKHRSVEHLKKDLASFAIPITLRFFDEVQNLCIIFIKILICNLRLCPHFYRKFSLERYFCELFS